MVNKMLNLPQQTTYPAVLGRILARIRERQGLDQTKIAQSLGVSQPTWSRFERGETPMTVSMLSRAAQALGTSPSAILAEVDEANRGLAGMGVRVDPDPPSRSNSETALLVIGGALLSILIAKALAK
jgi:transcriptional regulator with XRE-family HTH domain